MSVITPPAAENDGTATQPDADAPATAGQENSVVIPDRPDMDAAEVLSWIAFRKALSLNLWGQQFYHLSREWPWHVHGFYAPPTTNRHRDDPDSGFDFLNHPVNFLALLKEMESGTDWRDRIRDPVLESLVESRMKSTLHDAYLPDIISDLESDLGKAKAINHRILSAGAQLRRALEGGVLQAVGSMADQWGRMLFSRRPIDAKIWVLGVEIFPDGTVNERDNRELRSHLLFDTCQVLAAWPADRTPSPTLALPSGRAVSLGRPAQSSLPPYSGVPSESADRRPSPQDNFGKSVFPRPCEQVPGLPAELANDAQISSVFEEMKKKSRERLNSYGRPEKRKDLARSVNTTTGFPIRRVLALYRYLPNDLKNPARTKPP